MLTLEYVDKKIKYLSFATKLLSLQSFKVNFNFLNVNVKT